MPTALSDGRNLSEIMEDVSRIEARLFLVAFGMQARRTLKPEVAQPLLDYIDKRLKELSQVAICEICNVGEITEEHCKLVCPNCGHARDCSDP